MEGVNEWVANDSAVKSSTFFGESDGQKLSATFRSLPQWPSNMLPKQLCIQPASIQIRSAMTFLNLLILIPPDTINTQTALYRIALLNLLRPTYDVGV